MRLQTALQAVRARRSTGTASRSSACGPTSPAGIETEEQLDAALAGIREKCEPLIGAGKKIVLG